MDIAGELWGGTCVRSGHRAVHVLPNLSATAMPHDIRYACSMSILCRWRCSSDPSGAGFQGLILHYQEGYHAERHVVGNIWMRDF